MRALTASFVAAVALVLGSAIPVAEASAPAVRPVAGTSSHDNGSGWQRPVLMDSLECGTKYYVSPSVSCPSTSFRVVADREGHVASYDGSAWSEPVRVAATYHVEASVSCASEQACVVVELGGQGGPLRRTGVGEGSHRRPRRRPDRGVLPDGQLLRHGRRRRRRLHLPERQLSGPYVRSTPRDSPRSPARPPDSCVAVDDDGAAVQLCGWKLVPRATVINGSGLNAVSCPQRDVCAAVDAYGRAFRYADGASGGDPMDVDSGYLSSVSCTSDQFCVAISGGGVSAFDGTLLRHPSIPRFVGATGSHVRASRSVWPSASGAGAICMTAATGRRRSESFRTAAD